MYAGCKGKPSRTRCATRDTADRTAEAACDRPSDTRHSGQDGGSLVRQAFVRLSRIEADPSRLSFQLGDGCVELLWKDTASKEIDLLHGQVTVSVQSHAHDGLEDGKRAERAEWNEGSGSDRKR